ncbi:DUF1992 domain-containing protein [Arthrobacter sp. ATA002]|uniref:DnaJ family domain-containing protein n=1 Tax=Arthrobacter sp. ATA002 TaxID=2991715 RepID=UPI0022A79994|nr:DUF1992 domain-containing protein [Arthrobacter sp. ATA002]WAP51002.1 DUF1992 domain-containing protein [Arthrobacter sp. ATA002]
MGSTGAEAYRKRLEQAARLKAAGTPENAGYKMPEGLGGAREDELAAKRRKISAADKADYLIRDAMNRGEFQDLRYAGKPIPGLGDPDPDWWIKRLIKRENISGLGPPALLLRVEDEEFGPRLDRLPSERQVRDAVEDFNSRIIEARRQLLGGPPVITKLRDAEEEVRGWRERRGLPAGEPEAEALAAAANGAGTADTTRRPGPRRWLRRLRERLAHGRPGRLPE